MAQRINTYFEFKQEISKSDVESMFTNIGYDISIRKKYQNSSYVNISRLLCKDEEPVAILEIYNGTLDYFEYYKNKVKRESDILNGIIGIVTDGIHFYVYQKEDWFVTIEFNIFCNVLRGTKTIAEVAQENAIAKIKGVLRNSNTDVDFTNIIGHIKYENHKCCFEDGCEKDFWDKLLGGSIKGGEVCRYTTLDTLFYTLNGKQYWMQGIVGMNDISEVNYFDNYCNTGIQQPTEESNECFILSCNPKKDDLTMWRLYSEDAKGICMVFEVPDIMPDDYKLYNVSYADENGVDVRLNLVKQLIENGLEFSEIKTWKHFFKSYEYSVEEEIRLLCPLTDKTRRWLKLASNSILNPHIEIMKDDFPLKLKEVILGPKCPEKITNEFQGYTLATEKGFRNISVTHSRIKNYR